MIGHSEAIAGVGIALSTIAIAITISLGIDPAAVELGIPAEMVPSGNTTTIGAGVGVMFWFARSLLKTISKVLDSWHAHVQRTEQIHRILIEGYAERNPGDVMPRAVPRPITGSHTPVEPIDTRSFSKDP